MRQQLYVNISFWVIICLSANGQPALLDSLKSELSAELTFEEEWNTLFRLSDEYIWIHLDTAKMYGESLVEKSRLKALPKPIADAQLQLAYVLGKRREMDYSYKLISEADSTYRVLNDSAGIGHALYREAYNLGVQGDFDSSMELAVEALRILEKENDFRPMANCNLTIGELFRFQGEQPQAIPYHLRGIEIWEQLGDKKMLVDELQRIGHAYRMNGEVENSKASFQKALNLAKQLNYNGLIQGAHEAFGFFYADNNNFEESINHLDTALSYAKLAKNPVGEITLNGSIGQTYNAYGYYEEAIPYLKTATQQAIASNEPYFLGEFPGFIANCYANLGQYDSAFHYQKIQQVFQDSIESIEVNKRLHELSAQFETEKKEATISLLQENEKLKDQQIQAAGTRQMLSFAALAMVLLFAGILYYYFRLKQKTNKVLEKKNSELDQQKSEIEKQNREKELLLKEIHHRVKNNLQIISSLFDLQAMRTKDPLILNTIRESQNRVKSMGLIHQRLYQDENIGSIEMLDFIPKLGKTLDNSFGGRRKGISLTYDVEDIKVDVDTSISLGLIVNELLTNSFKYAFPENREGTIDIKLKVDDERSLALEIADNGVGFGETKDETRKSFGMTLVEMLAKKHKGEIEITAGKGTLATVKLKDYKLVS